MSRLLPTLLLSLALIPAADAAAAPSFTLTPDTVKRGEFVTAKGRGWMPPREAIENMYFGLRGPDGQRIHIGNANVSKHGRWTFTYKITYVIDYGKWKMTARQNVRQKDGSLRRVRRLLPFRVTRR